MQQTVILFHPRTHHERNYRHYWVPYSILAVAAPLVVAGLRVLLWDNNMLGCTSLSEYQELLRPYRDDLICVGVSAMIGHQIRDGLRFSQAMREVNEAVPIIWGGPLPTILPDVTLQSPLVDVAVGGQGEMVFLELVRALQEGFNWRQIPGLSYRDEKGDLMHNPPARLVDKNKLPAYPWHLLDLAHYVKGDEHVNSRILNYVSSQGCPYACGFCSDPAMFHQRWTGLKPERMVEEISYLVQSNDLNGIKFYDSTFFANPVRTVDFARLLIDTQMGIKWAASAHPRLLLQMDSAELERIAQSGLTRLLVGLESGVQRELDLVGKNLAVSDLYKVAERLSQLGIHGAFTMIVGFPGSTADEIEQSLRFGESLRALDPGHEVKVHIYAPYPGTPLYSLAMTHGFVPPSRLEEWADCDYYEAQTPWVPHGIGTLVRQFNEAHCPYVL